MHFLETHKKQIFAILAAIILLGAAVLLFYKLGHEAFQDYDEATYAEVTSESLAHGNFLSFTLLNSPYFKKPPLLFWLIDASREVVPNQEVAMRLPGALSGLALVALVILFCYEVSGSVAAALLAGSILTTTGAFIEPARQVRFDILVSLFIIATWYAFVRALRSTKNPKWYLVAGVFFGLAFLSKDIISVFAGVAVLSYVCVRRDFSFLRNKYFWGGAALSLLIILPWHLYETFRYGAAFWETYLGSEVLNRVQANIFGNGYGPTNSQYLWYFFNFAAPWAQLFCACVIAGLFFVRRISPQIRDVLISAIVTIIVISAVMALSQTKALSYLIPLYPFIAIVIALVASEIFRLGGRDWRSIVIGIFIVCLPYGLHIAIYEGFHINPYYSYDVEYAHEEKAIGLILAAAPANPIVYVYNDNDFGSIEYYSTLPFTKNPYLYLLSDTSKITPNSFVFTHDTQSELTAEFPQYMFTPLYIAGDVLLFGVSDFSTIPTPSAETR